MIITVIILTHAVSLYLQLPACVTIHNQCSNIKLVSPVYFGNGIVCPKLSDQQIDIDTAMRACFEINVTQNDFEYVLLFKLQRYSDSQHNMDTSTIETNKRETTYVYMLVVWRVKDDKFAVYVASVEHTREFIWNEDKLRKLYNKNYSRLNGYDDTISDTWLVDNNIVLKTTFNARVLERTPELSISISEEKKSDYAMRPIWIDTTR
jgi:hypothetical protein